MTEHKENRPHPEMLVLRALTEGRARFLAFLRRRVQSPEIAEDILHASYIRAIKHVHELQDEIRADSWFYRLLRNAVVDHHRRSAVSSKVVVAEMPADLAIQSVQQTKTCPCATRELTRLRGDYARALEQVEMDGMPVQAFAAKEGIAPGTASVRLHRARKALAERIQAACGPCAGEGCFDCTCA
jgi:RNA polymerase sigma-70 factor (ECF subfamily)